MNTKRYDDLKARATELAWLLGQARRYVPPGALATLIGYMFDPAVEQPTESCIAAAVARAEQAEATAAAMREAFEVDAGPLVEALAHVEHERWGSWMAYLFTKGQQLKDGRFAIHADSVSHWRRQVVTKYADLSEKEKESDRIEVRKTLAATRATLATDAGAQMLERERELERKLNAAWVRRNRLLRACQSLHRAWRRERDEAECMTKASEGWQEKAYEARAEVVRLEAAHTAAQKALALAEQQRDEARGALRLLLEEAGDPDRQGSRHTGDGLAMSQPCRDAVARILEVNP